MNTCRENKVKVVEATIAVFKRKGMKFTMDDIAKELGMSKKTIYTIFRDKEHILLYMVDYAFDKIKESEEEVLRDDSLPTLEKLRKLLGVLPDGYREIDFRQLYHIKYKYPSIYHKIEERLDLGWDSTLNLIEQGVKEGVIKPFNFVVFKATFEAAIGQFFEKDVLIPHDISYADALDSMVSILVDGIAVK